MKGLAITELILWPTGFFLGLISLVFWPLFILAIPVGLAALVINFVIVIGVLVQPRQPTPRQYVPPQPPRMRPPGF